MTMFYARVRLHVPEFETADGATCVLGSGLEWQSVPYLEPDKCNHEGAMCRGCAHTWSLDHEVITPSWI